MPVILSIDQSTSGTKGLLFDTTGKLLARADVAHRQITNELDWVKHDPLEIYENTLAAAGAVLQKCGMGTRQIAAAGIPISEKPASGVVASLAWGLDKTFSYVLEGNINYAGAVTKWLVDDIGLLKNSADAGRIAASIESANGVYLVPAFTGLGAHTGTATQERSCAG